jgi:hypothetical protein
VLSPIAKVSLVLAAASLLASGCHSGAAPGADGARRAPTQSASGPAAPFQLTHAGRGCYDADVVLLGSAVPSRTLRVIAHRHDGSADWSIVEATLPGQVDVYFRSGVQANAFSRALSASSRDVVGNIIPCPVPSTSPASIGPTSPSPTRQSG